MQFYSSGYINNFIYCQRSYKSGAGKSKKNFTTIHSQANFYLLDRACRMPQPNYYSPFPALTRQSYVLEDTFVQFSFLELELSESTVNYYMRLKMLKAQLHFLTILCKVSYFLFKVGTYFARY